MLFTFLDEIGRGGANEYYYGTIRSGIDLILQRYFFLIYEFISLFRNKVTLFLSKKCKTKVIEQQKKH